MLQLIKMNLLVFIPSRTPYLCKANPVLQTYFKSPDTQIKIAIPGRTVDNKFIKISFPKYHNGQKQAAWVKTP